MYCRVGSTGMQCCIVKLEVMPDVMNEIGHLFTLCMKTVVETHLTPIAAVERS